MNESRLTQLYEHPEPFIFGEQTTCPRCGREVKANEHVVRLTLVNGVHDRSTDMQDAFHHACAAELFEQFHGKSRGTPLRD